MSPTSYVTTPYVVCPCESYVLRDAASREVGLRPALRPALRPGNAKTYGDHWPKASLAMVSAMCY